MVRKCTEPLYEELSPKIGSYEILEFQVHYVHPHSSALRINSSFEIKFIFFAFLYN